MSQHEDPLTDLLMETETQSNTENVRDTLSVDTIIHMGAGRCTELNDYLAIKPRQLVLVEADIRIADTLQSRINGLEQVQVICSTVMGHPGPAILYRYNLPEANGLHQAVGLINLFPGLKLLEQHEVLGVSPVTLIEPLQLQAEKENRLVIDLPGEELPVLQALKQAQQLYLFTQIILHCGRKPLYEGSEPAIRILDWLREAGFDLVSEDESRDPDRPCWSLRRNTLQLLNRDLQRQLKLLEGDNGKLMQLNADLQGQIAQLVEERNNQSKVAGELEARISELTKLTADRQAEMAHLTQQRDHQAKLVADLQAQNEQLVKERNNQGKVAGELESRISELTKLTADRQAEMAHLTQQRDHQAKLIADLQAQNEQLVEERNNQSKIAGELESRISELTKLTADRQAEMAQLTKERDHQAKLVTDLQAQNEQLVKERNNQGKVAGELESQISELTKLTADRQAEMAHLTKERDHQAKLVADLQGAERAAG